MNFDELSPNPDEQSRLPKYLGIAAIFVFLVSMSLLFNDSWLRTLFSEGSSGEALAVVERTHRDIRRRTLKEMAWYKLHRDDDIFENDMVFSGKNSSASVTFKDGSGLKIEQNSLVIFRTKNGKAELSLKYGKFTGRLSAGQKLNVLVGGKSKTISADKKTDITIEKVNDKTEVKVLRGALSFDNQNLISNQKLAVSEEGAVSDVQLLSFDLLEPVNQKQVWLKPSDALDFSWAVNSPTDELTLKIARDPAFSQTVFKKTLSGRQSQTTVKGLPPGRYHWQVSSAGEKAMSSESFQFEVFPETPVRLIYPPEKANFQLSKTVAETSPTQTVSFVLEDRSGAESFLLEVSNEPEFQEPVISSTIAGPRLEDIELPPGEYHWRAKVVDSHRGNADWSQVGGFSIVDQYLPLSSPLPLSRRKIAYTIPPQSDEPALYQMTDREVSRRLRNKLSSLPRLGFSSVEFADKYEIQSSENPQFPAGERRRFRSSTAEFRLVPVEPGRKFIRLQALNEKQPRSEFSSPIEVEVKVSAPRVFGPEVVTLRSKPRRLRMPFSWSRRVFAKHYELQVSTDHRFTRFQSHITKSTSLQLPVKPEQKYFYRVRALDPQKRPISEFSVIHHKSYRIKKPPRRLASVPKKKVPTKTQEEPPVENPLDRSPASLLVPISAHFANWPNWKLEIGSFAGFADYQSNYADFSLSNEDLNQNQSFYISGYYSSHPRTLLNAYYEVIGGTTSETDDFSTQWLGLGASYRLWGDLDRGLAFFVGGGLEHAQYFRFAFESDISDNLENRPISMGSAYFSTGLEWRSYYQLRGSLSFSYYQGFFANSESSDTTEFDLTSNQQFAIDSSIAHSLTTNTYLGIGLRYRLINYGFTSNEFGTTEAGDSSTSHLLFRVFVGAER